MLIALMVMKAISVCLEFVYLSHMFHGFLVIKQCQGDINYNVYTMVKYLKVLVLTSYFNCQNTTLHKKWNRNYHKIIRIFLGTKINVIMLKYA